MGTSPRGPRSQLGLRTDPYTFELVQITGTKMKSLNPTPFICQVPPSQK
jgi:hypothetical protein